ncbi:MAG: alpha-2-macroglobulin family protein [Myxococcota bacterium]
MRNTIDGGILNRWTLAAMLVLGVTGCQEKKSGDKTPIQVGERAGPVALAAPEDPPGLEEPPEEADVEEPPPAASVQVRAEPCHILGCRVTLSFSEDMVQKPNGAETPKIAFEPPMKGEWLWENPRRLVFTPEANEMLAQNPYAFVVPKLSSVSGVEMSRATPITVYAPTIQFTSKVGADWRVVKNKPRFVGILNGNTKAIGAGPLLLAYDQRVSAKWVKDNLKATSEEQPVKVRVFRPKSTTHAYPGELEPYYFAAVQLPRDSAIQSLALEIPSWSEDEELELRPLELKVKNDFSVTATGFYSDRWSEISEDPQPLNTILKVGFSNGFNTPKLAESLKITPEPEDVDIRNEWGTAWIYLRLKPGTQYQATTTKAFTDILGNRLDRRVNVRFRSKDLPPILTLPSEPILVEVGRARIAVRGRNLRRLKPRLTAFGSPEDFARALERGQASSCEGLGARGPARAMREVDFPETMNEMQTVEFELSDRGQFCVEVAARGRGSEGGQRLSQAMLVQSADVGVTAKVSTGQVLAWVTTLTKPAPIEGAIVRLLNRRAQTVAQAKTGSSGIAKLDAGALVSRGELRQPLSIVVETEAERVVTRLQNDRLSKAWQFGLPADTSDPLYASVFTDRGAYRPGEKMYAKVIVGPAGWLGEKTVSMEVRDARGERVVKRDIPLDAYGTAALELRLKEAAAVGQYAIHVEAGRRRTSRTFKVEEYRVPTFRVKVAGGAWSLGENAEARIMAKYMHGGALGGRTARWQLNREPHVFAPSNYRRYVFAYGDASGLAGTLAGGERFLDDQGAQVIRFMADHPSAAGPMRYTLEATVTDIDRQAYSGRLSRVVHPAAFYVGVQPPAQQVLQQGETLKVPVVAISPQGKPVPGVETRVRLERIDHHTTARMAEDEAVQLLNREVDVPQDDCIVKTSKTAVVCTFKLAEAGRYRVRAWARDTDRRDVQAGFEVFASGKSTASWPRFDQDRIDVVADKASYKPGETAKLLIQSPYEKALGLLTLERDGVVSQRTFSIEKNTPALEVPIEAAHAPNVYASVVLVRGRKHDERDASGFETGAPGFKLGYAHLEVEPIAQRLAVTVSPARKRTTPGSEVDVTVTLKGPQGSAAPGQVTLWAVDEAVLGLTGYRTPNPEAELYAERALGVRTGESRLELPHAKRSRRETLFPGGDGEEDGPRFTDIAVELRKLFESTAYWNPDVQVGESGKATVTMKVPDNITTYRVMAVAVDSGGRVGSDDAPLLVKKPLIVQPVLPRFVYPGDQLEVQALAFNGTAKDTPVQFVAELEGVEPVEKKRLSGSVRVEAGAQGRFAVPVKVTGSGEAKIRFAAQMGEHKDAVEITLPILPPGTKRTAVASKTINGTDTVAVDLPGERVAGSTKLEVVASTTALTELKDAVGYLMGYPNGCIEQTTSTAYPLVVLQDLLPEIGVEVSLADLKKFSEAGVKRILSFQTEGGGLSYWPGGTEPHAFATSFGLTALIAAKERGYDVPQSALNRMADYLEQTLRQGQIQEEIPHGNIADGDSRALFVMTLGRLGRPQPGYISKLWQSRDKLTAFGLSFLGIAAAELPGDTSLVRPILAAVKDQAQREREEAWFEGERKGGYSFDSPLRTHASALLAYASGASSDEMSGKLLTGLLKRRNGGLWGNTQENVFGIMGVHRLLGSQGGGEAPSMTIDVGGRSFADAEMERVSRRVRRLRLQDTQLGLEAGQAGSSRVTLNNSGGKPVILTVRAEYAVPLNESNRKAVSRGFRISRSYETLEGDSLEGNTIPLGSLVRVRLRVANDSKLNYVAIDDKLPAGLEPLNTALETTERVSLGALNEVAQRSLGLLSYQEIRDHRVAFFVDEMPKGDYEYAYVARATTPGAFLRPAGRAEAMYEPEVFGTTRIDTVTVK